MVNQIDAKPDSKGCKEKQYEERGNQPDITLILNTCKPSRQWSRLWYCIAQQQSVLQQTTAAAAEEVPYSLQALLQVTFPDSHSQCQMEGLHYRVSLRQQPKQ